jgi:hypothetical protein
MKRALNTIEKISWAIMVVLFVTTWVFQKDLTLLLSIQLNLLAVFYIPVNMVWLLTGSLTQFNKIDVFSNFKLFLNIFLFSFSMGSFFAGLFFRINNLPGSFFILSFSLILGLIAVILSYLSRIDLRSYIFYRYFSIVVVAIAMSLGLKMHEIEFVSESAKNFYITDECKVVYDVDRAFECSMSENVNIFLAVYDSKDEQVTRKIQAFARNITMGHVLLIQQPKTNQLGLDSGFYIVRSTGEIVASEEISVTYTMLDDFIRVYPTK